LRKERAGCQQKETTGEDCPRRNQAADTGGEKERTHAVPFQERFTKVTIFLRL